MASAVKFQPFVEHLAEKVHNLGGDALTIALSAGAPTVSWDELADVTQIAYTNLSGSRVVGIASSSQTSGTYKLMPSADITLTATGTVPTFRYVILYNDTPAATPTDPLILYWDYGSNVDLASGDTFTIDFDTVTNGLIQIA